MKTGGFFAAVVAAGTVALALGFVQCVGDEPVTSGSNAPDAAGDGASGVDGAGSDGAAGDATVDGGPPIPEGVPAWSMIIDKTDDSESYVATDAAGNVYVAVGFIGTDVAFADKKLTSTGMDIAVAKLSPDGKSALWAVKIGGDAKDEPYAISVDAAGGVYVAGTFASTTLDASGKTANRGTSGASQGFVAKLNAATGAGEWVDAFTIDVGGNPLEGARCRTVRATSSGLAFACDYLGALTFPGGTNSLTDRLGSIVGTLDPSNGSVKTKQFLQSTTAGNLELVNTSSIDVDSGGNVYLAGTTRATQLVLGATTIPQTERKGVSSGFVMKLKPDLSFPPLWFRILGSTSNASASASARALRVDPTRSAVYVTGAYAFAADFGFGDVAAKCNCISTDVYLVKFDLTGTPGWQKSFGADANDIAGAIDVDPWGRPVTAAALGNVGSLSIDGKALPSGNLFVLLKVDPADGKALSVTGRKASTFMRTYGVASSPANGHTVVSGELKGTIELETPRTSGTSDSSYVVDLTP